MSFFFTFFTFLQKSTKKHQKALKSKNQVFLMQVEAGGEGRRGKNGHPKALPARARRSQHPQAPAPTSPAPMLTHFLPTHPVQRSSHHRVNTSLNAWHCTTSASQAEGAVFTEEALQLGEAVVEGGLQEDVLHGVLYS